MFKHTAKKIIFRQQELLSGLEQRQLDSLRAWMANLDKVCIAYSGGVDSSLVAAIAFEQLGSDAIAITGVSPALAPKLLNEARLQAEWIGIAHKERITKELENPAYSNNPFNRCYACKNELHKQIKTFTRDLGQVCVLDGVNHDDLQDIRPGIEAGKQAGVKSPLAELKISKQSIRQISRALGFPWWDKPAQPCLASRFVYGESITAERLNQVAQAEAWLNSRGYKELRVRIQGLTARIEIPTYQIEKLIESNERNRIVSYFLSLGFSSVSLDLEGLISGKLNRNI